ncbi:YopT-type cysteine protease domain-containing protein [Erwinia sp. PK3-005]|uniref:Peptidase C58 YopT-type domain-containing protein n=1 Tax=Mixta hanseatica TaxID=2872648 RepID=A0ABY4RDY3_9GAMM|nr:YopT-type cysteine protease domain-containing protein [Mixta hanseatica]UQY45722.1 hypothetical protein K6958_08765 [Mixta hanseatica]
MLPKADLYNGKNIYSFNQSRNYPMKFGCTNGRGACLGLAFHWMKMHKLGQYIAFPSTMLLPGTIATVENLQAMDHRIISRILHSTDLTITMSNIITSDIIARVSQELAASSYRYELMTFFNGPIGHAVVIALNRPGIIFFDPNYGCTSFPCRKDFIDWFINCYWTLDGGPGNPTPCFLFKITGFF